MNRETQSPARAGPLEGVGALLNRIAQPFMPDAFVFASC